MHPHEIHHIKTYIVFFILSAVSVGFLAYLYIPTAKKNNTIQSSVIQEAITSRPLETRPVSDTVSPVKTDVLKVTETDASLRRMRLVKVLIRSQQELKTLENQRSTSSQGLDTASEDTMQKLREKITALEKQITDIK